MTKVLFISEKCPYCRKLLRSVPLDDVEVVDVKVRHHDTQIANVLRELEITGVPTLVLDDANNLLCGQDVFDALTNPRRRGKEPSRAKTYSDETSDDDEYSQPHEQSTKTDDDNVFVKVDKDRLTQLANRYS